MTDDRWKHDTEYESITIAEVKKEADSQYSVKDSRGWSLWWECDFDPQAGEGARYFGGGIGYTVRGIVYMPKGGEAVVVRYQSPEEYEVERQAQREAYEKECAALVKQPSVELDGRVFDSAMGEISGFGGGYEETCRKMALAGMKWLDEHSSADPQFHGYTGIYGVISDDNDDAKVLTKAIIDASGGDCTGAMHQACVSHVMAYKRLGWDGYRAEMLKRDEQPA